jgi:hypothetical protein
LAASCRTVRPARARANASSRPKSRAVATLDGSGSAHGDAGEDLAATTPPRDRPDQQASGNSSAAPPRCVPPDLPQSAAPTGAVPTRVTRISAYDIVRGIPCQSAAGQFRGRFLPPWARVRHSRSMEMSRARSRRRANTLSSTQGRHRTATGPYDLIRVSRRVGPPLSEPVRTSQDIFSLRRAPAWLLMRPEPQPTMHPRMAGPAIQQKGTRAWSACTAPRGTRSPPMR